MKRIVICCDGTWSVPDQRCGELACPTNVVKTALTVGRHGGGAPQHVYYGRGIGTGRRDHLLGGAFGVGLTAHILDAYTYLIEEYEPGDDLYLFGFSRGAYTVRSLAGLIRNCGILKPRFRHVLPDAYRLYRRRDAASHPARFEAQLFRRAYTHEADGHVARIKFVGVWDTVGALGIPVGVLGRISRRVLGLQFHDTALSSFVDNAFQALAIDERRRSFTPAIWTRQAHAAHQRLEQVWFAGVHSSVGGGTASTGLSDIAFEWMRDRARRCGLEFDDDAPESSTAPDPFEPFDDSWNGIYRLLPPRRRHIESTGRPAAYGFLHPSAAERRDAMPSYCPPNLPADSVIAPLGAID
jgi:uncharacterized protein (DUF2235 family)